MTIHIQEELSVDVVKIGELIEVLCNCLSCGRVLDCNPSQICDVCEIGADITRGTPAAIVKETEATTKKKSPTSGNGTVPMRRSFLTNDGINPITTDHQIMSILKRLHTSMHGPERECRWHYHDSKQVYWCDHIAVSSREVADIYWSQFNL